MMPNKPNNKPNNIFFFRHRKNINVNLHSNSTGGNDGDLTDDDTNIVKPNAPTLVADPQNNNGMGVVSDINDGDGDEGVKNILDGINEKIKKISTGSNPYSKVETLVLPNNKTLNYKCITYNKSEVENTECEYADSCESIKDLLIMNNIADSNIDDDFLNKLTNYDITIADYLFSESIYDNMTYINKIRTLDKIICFVDSSIDIMLNFANNKSFVSDNIISNTYSLLYLKNLLVKQRSTIGNDITEVTKLNDQMIGLINENIELYRNIVKQNNTSYPTNDVSDLINNLESKIKYLQSQKKSLSDVINDFKNNIKEIGNKIDNSVKTAIDHIEQSANKK
jgi:chaperonin cofactor prefoldin